MLRRLDVVAFAGCHDHDDHDVRNADRGGAEGDAAAVCGRVAVSAAAYDSFLGLWDRYGPAASNDGGVPRDNCTCASVGCS